MAENSEKIEQQPAELLQNNLELAAAKQLQQLDLEGKLNGNNNKKPNNSRSSSRTRKTSSSSNNVQSPSSPDVKKLPMNKIVVGVCPSPQVSKVSSKIGSLSNTSYKPSGGKIKIESKKLTWKAESKIGSLSNVKHQPGGGDVKITNNKLSEVKAAPRIGSLANVKHQPGGGDVKITTQKVEIKSASRIGSLANVKHQPGGGDKQIYDETKHKNKSRASSSASNHESF